MIKFQKTRCVMAAGFLAKQGEKFPNGTTTFSFDIKL